MWDGHPFLRNVTYDWRWLWPAMRQSLKPPWSTLEVLVSLDLVKVLGMHFQALWVPVCQTLKCSAINGIATSHLPTRLADQCRRESRKLVRSWGDGTLPHGSVLMRAAMLILVTASQMTAPQSATAESHQSSVFVSECRVRAAEGRFLTGGAFPQTPQSFTRIKERAQIPWSTRPAVCQCHWLLTQLQGPKNLLGFFSMLPGRSKQLHVMF